MFLQTRIILVIYVLHTRVPVSLYSFWQPLMAIAAKPPTG